MVQLISLFQEGFLPRYIRRDKMVAAVHVCGAAMASPQSSSIWRTTMGVLWEVVQTGLMYGQKRKSDSVEDRVKALEDQLLLTQNTLRALVKKLEQIHGMDIDQDGKIG
jgi:hypothetical protein